MLMGVSGSGKTSVGKSLAQKFKFEFLEGDDYHPSSNLKKMSRGVPLTESDRSPWLIALRQTLDSKIGKGHSIVVSCSALTRESRKKLGVERDVIRLIHLHAPESILKKRISQRNDHFMPESLLESQFDALEEPEPEEAFEVDVSFSLSQVVNNIADFIKVN